MSVMCSYPHAKQAMSELSLHGISPIFAHQARRQDICILDRLICISVFSYFFHNYWFSNSCTQQFIMLPTFLSYRLIE